MTLRKEIEELATSITINKTMMNPPHVGEVIRNEILKPLNLTINNAAKILGVSRPNFNTMLLGKRDLSMDLALKINRHFGVDFELLLKMQLAYKVSQARKVVNATMVELQKKKEKVDGQEV